jgi:hypothetical protein
VSKSTLLVGSLTALVAIGVATVTIVGSSEKLCAAPANPATVSFSEDVLPLLKMEVFELPSARRTGI